jgi:hypothetical protein
MNLENIAPDIELLEDKFALIKEEIDSGHFYSDSCQFHEFYR